MNRRMFMAALGTGVAAGTVAASPVRAGQAPTISSYVTNVADVFGAKPLPMQKGERLRLWLDPSRKYDPGTVVVGTQTGRSIGYLPTVHSQLLGPLLTAGFAAEVEVKDVRNDPRPALRIAISMHIA